MEGLFFVLAASMSAATLLLWSRTRTARAEEPPQLPAADRTPLTLQIGDVVEHLDRDYLVEGALLLSESPRAARLCRLIDGSVERFLYAGTHVEDAWLLEPVDAPAESRSDQIMVAGERLRLERRWRAATLSAGKLGHRTFDAELGVHEYVSSTGRFVLLLEGAQRDVAFVGERLLPHAVEILPGRG